MNMQSKSDSYAAAGVDITAGYKAVELMKKHIARTVVNGGNADIGGFGGLFVERIISSSTLSSAFSISS